MRVLNGGILFLVLAGISFSRSEKRETLAGFQIEEGFSLSLVGSEPLFADPVDFEFNEAGEAMVLEMPGYPFEDQQSRIVLLQDTNNDGVYDDSQVFAENLQLATSFLPYKEGALVAAPPYLLYVKDLDKDKKADAIDTLMGGFSTGNLQHNYNGLTYGLDNWIYAVNGGNSGKPFWWGDSSSRMDLRGQDFRFNLKTRVMERIGESSGGFGLGMDEWGRLYETHNLTHISHLVFPDRYLNGARLLQEHTLENISDHEENGLARIYPIGEQESRVNHPEQSGYFSGSCGITYYGGGAFGAEYNNTVWVADVVLNLIHTDKITAKGSSLKASRMMEKREFLASTDRSFRPVNMSVGPEGAMYVVDMHRQVIEHPEWIPDEIEKTLDLNAGKDKGRIYKITKVGEKNPFDVTQLKSIDGMIEGLKHSNQWVRKTAHRLLMDRELTDPQLNKLSELLTSENELARLHALWILQGKNKLTADQLTRALEDPTAGVRENALLIAENTLSSNQDLLKNCIALMTDADARVRMQAALTVSTLDDVMFDQHKAKLLPVYLEAANTKMDDWNIAAITLAAKHAAPEFFNRLVASGNFETNPSLLSSLALASSNSEADMQTIMLTLKDAEVNSEIKSNVIHQLSQGSTSGSGNGLLPQIRALEQTNDRLVISELANFRNRLQLPPSPEYLKYSREALKLAVDDTQADSVRIQQMSLIALLPYNEKSEVLYQSLQNSAPLKIQEEALRQLSKFREPEIGDRVVAIWKELSPQTRRYASDLLLYIESNHDALLTGLEQNTINIGEMNFDLERRRTLLWWTDNADTKRRARALFTDEGVTNRKEAIETMKPALTLAGSSINGEEVFESICSNCHVYGAIGKDVGPVLTEINRKSKESLLHEILDPNSAVDTKYINHRLETKQGDLHMGIVEAETDQYITIKKMGGEKVTINKTDIKTFNSLGTSLMMEGLENSMTPQEMADLLAFLQNLNT
ncbi:PVC-type heme-binding CxxCH protein [Algoriphagus antarcticus]|uniref:Putative membrane-bound dehydrogenase-like protein n=1 Tax=Algoriphagus antarcticus TaxID=238540 RepID=A0A3E0E874_9BACT|nr:PVC-type heme-binding CxxCH protein [Algoriphagus antarcticus]REG94442.1 putative membrane-bound dehydrogenase-like protein [Algoriphagus antarcticus]